jgi:exoribonuclease-2
MPGGKITMLPDEVVERFTLSEGKTCPALSMYLDVDDADFSVVATRTAVERVRITANLRHDTLEQLFNEETLKRESADYPFKRELALLWQFADRLEAARGKQDPGRTPQVDYNFVIENDRVSIARRLRGNPIDKVVSELMIHVNSSWAKTLGDKGYPAIYRCQNNGKVRMSTTPGKHQGLGVEQYMWSSSPLRRSVDLVNQRQLIALTRGEAPPYAANSDALFTALRDFEVAHEAYGDFQRSMERYWCMRYIQQEGIVESIATVVKENIVRFDNLPLTARVPSLPEIAPGTRVSLELSDIDLMELTFSCQFKHKLED